MIVFYVQNMLGKRKTYYPKWWFVVIYPGTK